MQCALREKNAADRLKKSDPNPEHDLGFSRVLRLLLSHTSISHPSRKFQPEVISGQVTKSGQVTLPQKYLGFRCNYSFWGINTKLSGFDEGISTYKIYISEFWVRWPGVRSTLRHHHYKARGKCSYAFFRKYEWERAIDLKIFLN